MVEIEGDSENDLSMDMKVLERELLDRLDPSIRHHMRKAGLSILENTYTGFDTEFTNIDVSMNTLISTQLAATTRSYLRVPRVLSYSISTIDVKSNKLLKMGKTFSVFNYAKLESSIQMSLQEIKAIKYGKYDEALVILNESLKQVKGLRYFESDEHTLFSFPRSTIQPYIKVSNSMSFSEVIKTSTCITKPYKDQTYCLILDLIREIYSQNFSMVEGKDKLLEEIYLRFSEYSGVSELAERSDNQLTPIIEGIGAVE